MVKILGLDISRNASVAKASGEDAQMDFPSARTSIPYYDTLATDGGAQIPIFPIPIQSMYELVKYSDILRNVLFSYRQEVFRNGIRAVKVFEFKCMNPACAKEFDAEPENVVCDQCQSMVFKPSTEQEKKAKKLITSSVNANEQFLREVTGQTEDDVNIVDTMYLQCLKDYYRDETGEIVYAEPKEILRGNPIFIHIIANRQGIPGYNENNEKVWTCIDHRDQVKYGERGKCQICKGLMFQAFFVAHATATSASGNYSTKRTYYIKDEIFKTSKFMPSLTYGFPMVLAVWQKAATLLNMDRYMKEYYKRQRPPNSLVLVNTKNPPSLQKAWEWLIEKVRLDPHFTHPLAVESDSKGGATAQVLKLMESLAEMEYTEAREEMRRTIGACWGVMPLFYGDTSKSGGLNNEGLQITVTNRAVESAQEIYNNKVFPWIMRQFGITDWKLELIPNEEQNEANELELEAKEIANAQGMQALGFEVELTHEGDFRYEKVPNVVQAPQPPQLQGQQEQPKDEQRFTGEPENVRRSFQEKAVKKTLSETFYDSQYMKHGDTALGVGWVSKESQEKRFEVIAKFLPEKGADILDVGCGTGELYAYLKKAEPHYRGIDRNKIYVMRAQQKGVPAETADLFDIKEGADYVVASGVFNLEDGAKEGIAHMFKIAKKAVIVNILEKGGAGYTNHNPQEMLDFCRKLDKGAELVNGYIDGDFTLVLRKDRQQETEEDIVKSFDTALADASDEVSKSAKYPVERAKLSPILRQVVQEALFSRKFKGLKVVQSNRIKALLLNAFRTGTTTAKLTDKILEIIPKMEKSQAELIVRTESASMNNAARELTYKQTDPVGENHYEWIGPNDGRTSQACKNIQNRTKKGVSLEELKKIVREESAKMMGASWETRDFVPHPMCRHTFVRSFK